MNGIMKIMLVSMMVLFLSEIGIINAAPMGTAFTYQGRLTDAGSPATASYDFRFRLYDALTAGTQVGSTITELGVPANEGYFKVELDFGNVFRGDATWLEIDVAPQGSGTYTTLKPRQEVTPTPYAMYADMADSVAGGIGIDGSGTANYIPKFLDNNTLENSVIYQNGTNIGIGSTGTAARLYVDGDIMLDYTDAYRISMYSGLGWNSSPGRITIGSSSSTVGLELYAGSTDPRMIIDEATGYIGIDNPTPNAKLHAYSDTTTAAIKGENSEGNIGYLANQLAGVYGTSIDGYGVRGYSTNDWGMFGSVPFGSTQAGVVGAITLGNGAIQWVPGSGVCGSSEDGYGVSGRVDGGKAIYGTHDDTGNFGYLATPTEGAYGEHDATGNFGQLGTANAGVYGETSNSGSYGVSGINSSTSSNDTPGVYGQHDAIDYYGIGVQGQGGYIGVEGRVSPTGSNIYYGVCGYVNGGSGTNYGVYGSATGGTTNYAGYFAGPLKVSTASGDTAVQLPGSSISASEILDEPGITRGRNSSTVTISTTGVTNITSSTITIPAAGYIVARAHSFGAIYGTSIGNIITGIETASTTSPTSGEYVCFGSNNESVGATSKYRWGTMAPERVFYVASPGTHTYYYNATRGYTDGTATVSNSKLVLTYFPTSYGTVTTAVSGQESTQFENVIEETITSDNAAGTEPAVETVYTVDLRELELKAAYARAEAERAEKELLEAQLKEKDQKPN
ncbi:MAG: hypothetical protein JXD22_03000 [Sedimentisphaerales bacterium]|nr:hypothetical protein [Sedimentisphaerales bacterium]